MSVPNDPLTLSALGLCELIGLILIGRLWLSRGPRMRPVSRVIWSLVLLLPLVGVLCYVLIRVFPDEHADDFPDSMPGGDPSNLD